MNPKSYQILIADDEPHTREALTKAFQLKGYTCHGAANGKDALEQLKQDKFDLIILDLRMPETDGLQVMNIVKEQYPDLTIIILTAHASLDSAITAVKAGAADYLLKPQSIAQLDAAVQNALRKRSPQSHRNHLISVMQQTINELMKEDFTDNTITQKTPFINSENQLVFRDAELQEYRFDLTVDQSKILQFLINHPNKTTSCREIAENVLGYANLSEKEAESMVRPHIMRIRRKIEQDPKDPQILKTVRGSGYILITDPVHF